jgi:hypothetical protein
MEESLRQLLFYSDYWGEIATAFLRCNSQEKGFALTVNDRHCEV